MTAARPLEEIFHALLELPNSQEQEAYLQSLSLSDTDRRQVTQLLKAHQNACQFLENGPEASLFSDAPAAMLRELASAEVQANLDASKFQSFSTFPCDFGDWELLEKIAHGGMGVVFRARQKSLDRIVAIKMIRAGQLAGEDEIQRFWNEADAAGRLDHPGIVPVFHVGSHEGQHYIAMAFIEGESLSEMVRRGPVSPSTAADLLVKIGRAIHAAHQQGIVHRDLKPGNVLIDQRGAPRVTDFGLAKRVEEDSQLTLSGMVLGTPSYMPPEQAAGKPIDAAADVYSLGAILYALLTGAPPFDGETPVETLWQVLHQEPLRLRHRDKQIPADLESICLKCLEKDPADRYASAAELVEDLERFQWGFPVYAKHTFLRTLRKWTVREPVLAAHLFATVVLIGIFVANYLWFGDRGEGRSHNLQLTEINIVILLAWALAATAYQKAQNWLGGRTSLARLWAMSNPVFLTLALYWNDEPRGLLFSLYFLQVMTSSFYRSVEVILITTLFSLFGCLFLIRFSFSPAEAAAPSYLVLFCVNLVVTGCLLALLTSRLIRMEKQMRN